MRCGEIYDRQIIKKFSHFYENNTLFSNCSASVVTFSTRLMVDSSMPYRLLTTQFCLYSITIRLKMSGCIEYITLPAEGFDYKYVIFVRKEPINARSSVYLLPTCHIVIAIYHSNVSFTLSIIKNFNDRKMIVKESLKGKRRFPINALST